jgi:hypothetical protein
MVANTRAAWLKLPSNWDERDARFRAVVASALQVNPREDAPLVHPPERVQFAVADGLCRWLEALHARVPIRGWTVGIQASTPDVVRVSMELEDEQVPVTRFTVRKHQVGVYGLADVLKALRAFAPMLDQPMDIQPRAAQVMLPLT